MIKQSHLLLLLSMILSVSLLDAQTETENNNSFATADQINLTDLSGMISGTINPDGDHDYYKVTVPEEGVFNFVVNNIPTNMTLELTLYDSQQQFVAAFSNSVSYTANELVCEGGLYYILIRDVSSGSDQSPDPYTLFVNFYMEDVYECNNSFVDAASIGFGQLVQAQIMDNGDLDYYQVSVGSSGVLNITLNGVPAGMNLRVTIFNNQQLELPSAFSSTESSLVLNKLVCEPGVYFILVEDVSFGVDESFDFYNLTVNFYTDDVYECNNTFADAASIELGQLVQAQIMDDNDLDYYKVTISTPGVFRINVTNAPSGMTLKADLYNSQQLPLANLSISNNFTLNYRVCEPGEYYILIQEVSFGADESFDFYNLTVNLNTDDIYECNDSFNDAASIGFDQLIQGQIMNSDDVDFYSIMVPETSVLRILMNQIPDNMNLEILVYNNLQMEVASLNSNQPFVLNHLICEPGLYFIRIENIAFGNAQSFEFYNMIVSLDTQDTFECNNSFDEATSVDCGGTYEATVLGAGDEDYYQIEITEPGDLQIMVNNVADNISIDLELYDDVFMPIGGQSPNNGFDVDYTKQIDEPGTYYFLITSDKNSTQPYFLTVNCPMTSSIGQISTQPLSVFPNPVTDILQIENNLPNSSYKILNTASQQVLQGELKSNTIDMSTLPDGVYMLLVFSESETYRTKVVKY